MNIKETKFGDVFKDECVTEGFEMTPSEGEFMLQLFIGGFVNFLSSVKDKSAVKSAIRVNDMKGNFLCGFACEYQKSTEESEVDTGNWNLIGSFEEEKIKCNALREFTDDSVYIAVVDHAARAYGARFNHKDFYAKLAVCTFRALIKYMNENAKSSEEILEVEDTVIFKYVAENDTVDKAMILDGSLKRRIKDDAVLALN